MAAECKIIDGKAIAEIVRKEIAADVAELKSTRDIIPGLAVVLVGDRKDSQTYVRMKSRAAAEAGFHFVLSQHPKEIAQDDLLRIVQSLNGDPAIHGIIVQLPLPEHINERVVLDAISLEKDVDGFHPNNIGCLAMKGRTPLAVPCTPRGCMELLERSGVVIDGKNAVVLGRSNIVGVPAALLLMHRNATVTICHSRTADIADHVRRADVVIAAIGKPEFVRGDWLKPGAAVVDVGINAVDDPSRKEGYRLVGDVHYEEAKKVAGFLTPVPGGVGPMTVAMLLKTTLESARRTAAAKTQ